MVGGGDTSLSSQLFPLGIFAFAEDLTLEVLEGYHDDCHVVERLSVKTIFEHALHRQPTLLMYALRWLVRGVALPFIFVTGLPDTPGDIFI